MLWGCCLHFFFFLEDFPLSVLYRNVKTGTLGSRVRDCMKRQGSVHKQVLTG